MAPPLQWPPAARGPLAATDTTRDVWENAPERAVSSATHESGRGTTESGGENGRSRSTGLAAGRRGGPDPARRGGLLPGAHRLRQDVSEDAVRSPLPGPRGRVRRPDRRHGHLVP